MFFVAEYNRALIRDVANQLIIIRAHTFASLLVINPISKSMTCAMAYSLRQ